MISNATDPNRIATGPAVTLIDPATGLSRREIEVLACSAGGGSQQEIADALFISRRTVAFHLGNAYVKLGVQNRMQALHMARRLGLQGLDQ